VYRSSPARKYGPLALIAAAQLVVVLVAPSTAPNAQDALATGSLTGVAPGAAGAPAGTVLADGSTVQADGSIVAADGTVVAPPGSTGTAGVSSGGTSVGGAGTTTTTAGAPGAPAPGSKPGTVAVAAGDTSHCVGGRQFDPKLDFFAPPCAPGKPGATGGDNGGATSMGVTKDKIVVVNYIPDYGAEVNAILRAQGLYYDAEDAKVMNAAFSEFINSKYNLSGRKVNIITYQGTCRTVPPDLPCLIGEMNTIAKRFKPFAVHMNTTVCSRCYAELARLKIVSFGGSGFSEEFRRQLKPYNYAEGISATRMAKIFANLWCNQMTSKGGSGRTAIYAGAQNPQQDFRDRPRELGVVSTDDPDNKGVVKDVLYPELAKCGEKVTHEYFYEQNVSTAEQQSQAGTAVMNSPQNPATSVVCFCDPVAPQFSYSASARNNYWPETLFASNQGLDTDPAGQTYMDSGGNPSLACPFPTRGCSFDNALGLGEESGTRPADQLAGVKIFKASGKPASSGLTPLVQENFWSNYNMLASLIQVTGPNLTPANMAASAPKLGSRGGGSTGFARRAFENGEQSWTRDVRLLYWNKKKTSVFNGKKGAHIQVGPRMEVFPKAKQPSIPTVDKRV
jgi:hypothetical protein